MKKQDISQMLSDYRVLNLGSIINGLGEAELRHVQVHVQVLRKMRRLEDGRLREMELRIKKCLSECRKPKK